MFEKAYPIIIILAYFFANEGFDAPKLWPTSVDAAIEIPYAGIKQSHNKLLMITCAARATLDRYAAIRIKN